MSHGPTEARGLATNETPRAADQIQGPHSGAEVGCRQGCPPQFRRDTSLHLVPSAAAKRSARLATRIVPRARRASAPADFASLKVALRFLQPTRRLCMQTMRMILRATLVAFAAMLGATSAMATTCHVGLQAGYAVGITKLSDAFGDSIDGAGSKSHDGLGGLAVGCDVLIPSTVFFVGAFGDYTWGKNVFSVNFGGPSFSASLSDTYSLGGRIGLQDARFGKAMPYLLAAYVHSKADVGPISSFSGWAWGGGVEYPIAAQLSMALEVRDTIYDSKDIGSGSNAVAVKPEVLSTMLRLNWDFYRAQPAAAPLK